jgi:polyferredoxin
MEKIWVFQAVRYMLITLGNSATNTLMPTRKQACPMLKKIRIIAASAAFALITLIFLDFTGTLHLCFGWLAKIQLVPAIFAVNIATLIALVALALLFGRVYCSILCPLGVMQDCISNISGRIKNSQSRFIFSKARPRLRYGMFALFLAGAVGHLSVILTLLEPYAAYGRIASNLVAPIYRSGNNLLAWLAGKIGSYAFYPIEVWIKSWIALGVATATIAVVGILAWRNGRIYCNSICPVGTFFGIFSRYSLFRPVFNTEKCAKCKLCEKSCKASCIDSTNMAIDHSRCVACFNCIEACGLKGLRYSFEKRGSSQPAAEAAGSNNSSNLTRRSLIAMAWSLAATHALRAQQQQFKPLQADGGLAKIADKKTPRRETSVIPPGAQSLRNMNHHCVACQLCISACPNGVLHPSQKLTTLNKPEMSFERGYCRPECTECSQACPTGSIKKITTAEKSAISIGRVEWKKDSCIVNRDKVQCKSCERHCPTDAIILVNSVQGDPSSLKIPAINNEKCTGCGACEYYCPARPFSAIYVEGHQSHHKI